jgi:glucose/arabinose dehydrogenase
MSRFLRILPILILAATLPTHAAPPAPFVAEPFGGTFTDVIGTETLPDGQVLAFERSGIVWLVRFDGTRQATPVLDIHDEVGAWRDHGLLGLAVHPSFPAVPDIFLLYVVDRHHLLNAGTPSYNSSTDEYSAATIGRVARYRLDVSGGPVQAIASSRRILIGETRQTGLPVCHQSHSVGSILFGRDGSLLLSMGDSASYLAVDSGGQVLGGYVNQALADGILSAKEDVGSFRAQLVDSLAGKVLRIDPETGNGIAGNPWYDAAAPRAARSRVWALGLRNPYRMTLLQGTGSPDPAAADPGTLVVGDVGWNLWEELSTITGPGQNLGWPIFEGLEHQSNYAALSTANPDAVVSACGTVPFRELIRQDSTASARFVAACRVLGAESANAQNAPTAASEFGFTGSGYRDFGDTTGAWIEWTINVPASGSIPLAFRFANGSAADRPLDVLVDGIVRQASMSFAPTGSWREWRVATTAPIALSAGNRVVRIRTVGPNGPNVDAMWLEGQAPAADLPAGIPTFTHRRPFVDWRHGGAAARTPAFTAAGAATVTAVGASDGALGVQFSGYCALGAPRADFASWPAEWRGVHFLGDYTEGWMRTARLDAAGSLRSVAPFDAGLLNLVGVYADHVNECLYVAQFSTLTRLSIPSACRGDLNGDGTVDGIDLGVMLGRWGMGGVSDLNRDGSVDGVDLGLMLGNWGPCAP